MWLGYGALYMSCRIDESTGVRSSDEQPVPRLQGIPCAFATYVVEGRKTEYALGVD